MTVNVPLCSETVNLFLLLSGSNDVVLSKTSNVSGAVLQQERSKSKSVSVFLGMMTVVFLKSIVGVSHA